MAPKQLVYRLISAYLRGTLPERTLLALLSADDNIVKLPVGFSERLHARIEASLCDSATGLGNRTARHN